jgi:hypothetical protein
MEHPDEELSVISASIWKDLRALSVWLVILKLAFVYGAIRELQGTLALFLAILPFPGVSRPISPLTYGDTVHFPHLPLSIILPALLAANEEP